MKTLLLPTLAILATTILNSHAAPAPIDPSKPLQERLQDMHAFGADHWIYNDLEKAKAEARALNKPIFVTFRCVPCKACSGFDAEVAKGSDLITTLAKANFVALRQVEMKGVDLTQFQFDHDLNWAAMFINADGTVYGRYGTQSAAGPDAYNSIASLEKAMLRVLALHAEYSKNAAALKGKLPPAKPYKTALEMPNLNRRETLRGQTERNNCIHCHNIHDAENETATLTGLTKEQFVYRYPLPDNIGLHIDPQDGLKIESVLAASPAAKAGLRAGDEVTHFNGQPAISIADMQWVLHGLPYGDASVNVSVKRAGKPLKFAVKMAAGWRKSDISWRGSMWSLRPRPGFWGPLLKEEELKAANMPTDSKVLRVQMIDPKQPQGKAALDAGLKTKDLLVGLNGQPWSSTRTCG
jgi:serine protease Do